MKFLVLAVVLFGILASVARLITGGDPRFLGVARLIFWVTLGVRAVSPTGWATGLVVAALILFALAKFSAKSRGKTDLPVPPLPDKKTELPETTARAASTWLPVSFELKTPATIRTMDRSPAELPAGDYRGRLRWTPFEEYDDDRMYLSPLESDLEFTAPDGVAWRVRSVLCLAPLLDLERVADKTSEVPRVLWEESSPEQRDALTSRCLIAGLRVGSDERIGFPLSVGDKTYCVFQKYLDWRVDLALRSDGREVFVRVSELLAERYDGDPFAHADLEKLVRVGEEKVPTFVYTLPTSKFLALTHPEAHHASLDEAMEQEEGDLEDLAFEKLSG